MALRDRCSNDTRDGGTVSTLNAVMITRWQYYLSAAMITSALSTALSVQIVIGRIHWIVNVSNCKELWIARRKHQHLQTAGKLRPLIRKTGWGTTERERAIYIWTERERKGDAVLYEKGG